MDYYVWPKHLYSHSRTCTHSCLCIRPSILVASFICYLLDHASVQEISNLMNWFHICQIFPSIMEILIHYISSVFMEIMILCISSSWRFWSIYIVHGDDHICHIVSCLFMAIGLLCIRDCYIYLQLCAEFDHYIVLFGWLVLPLGSSSLHFWDGLLMYFSHRMTPLTSHIRGHLLQLILPHMVDHTFMAFPIPLQTL